MTSPNDQPPGATVQCSWCEQRHDINGRCLDLSPVAPSAPPEAVAGEDETAARVVGDRASQLRYQVMMLTTRAEEAEAQLRTERIANRRANELIEEAEAKVSRLLERMVLMQRFIHRIDYEELPASVLPGPGDHIDAYEVCTHLDCTTTRALAPVSGEPE